MLIKPLINSLVIGVCVSVCAILLGSILAWLMVRSDLPFKKFFSLAVIIPYMIPSWTKALAWLAMFRNSTSGADGLLRLYIPAGILSTELHQLRAGGDG